MAANNRMILLFIYNCTVRNSYPLLSHVKIEFLSPNITSKLQPLDMGIIKDFKSLYRKEMVINLVNSINEKKFNSTILTPILVQIAYKACKNISILCIQNCFRACGFSKILNNDSLEVILIKYWNKFRL